MKKEKNSISLKTDRKTVQVLYQKLGSKWFAFSVINNELFFGSLGPEELYPSNTNHGDVKHSQKDLDSSNDL